MSPAEVATVSRAEQGLPETVEDPAVLARIVRLVAATAEGVRDE